MFKAIQFVVLSAGVVLPSCSLFAQGGCRGGNSGSQPQMPLTSSYSPMQMMSPQYANQLAFMQQQAYQRQLAYMQQISQYQAEKRLEFLRQQEAAAKRRSEQAREKSEYLRSQKAEKVAAAKAKREKSKLASLDSAVAVDSPQ